MTRRAMLEQFLAVVCREDNQGVLGLSLSPEGREHDPDLPIDVLHLFPIAPPNLTGGGVFRHLRAKLRRDHRVRRVTNRQRRGQAQDKVAAPVVLVSRLAPGSTDDCDLWG